MSKLFPKVLVSCPTAKAKNYCLEEYLNGVMALKYPNYSVRMYDNTMDSGANARYINKAFVDMFGEDNTKFHCENSMSINGFKRDSIQSVIERMVLSHNDCRAETIKFGYEWLLHLESDVIPPPDVIEKLMSHNKRVCAAPYYRDSGKYRRLCIQRRIYKSPHSILSENFTKEDDTFFMDGTLKEVAHAGLGCILIHRSVLQKIPFRSVQNDPCFPDSYFAEDCFKNGIKIYCDTSMLCEHRSQDWGIYGVDFK